MVMMTGCLNKVDQTKVIAKVGKTTYSVDDINSRINDLDPQLKEYFAKENKVRLLDQLIEEVIYQLAKKSGLQRQKDFKDTVKDLERQALINYYIQQNVDNAAQVTRAEVEEFYNTNSAQFAAFEARNLSHILVEKRAEAKRIQTRLTNGKSFESLAKEFLLIHPKIMVVNWVGFVKLIWYLSLLMQRIS